MKALDRLEAFLQELMERPSWLLLPRRLPPLTIAGALTRELEAHAIRLTDRVVVAGIYDVYLSPEDWADLDGMRETLERELADYIDRLALERDLSLDTKPDVRMRQETGLHHGEVHAVALFRNPARTPVSRPEESSTEVAPPVGGHTEALNSPRVRRVTPVAVRPASLILLGREGQELRRFVIDRPALTIGRRSSNDIAIPDLKMSREHARLEVVGAHYYLTDLNSTNGTFVNGRAVRERNELGAGDIIEIGLQRLRFEQ